MKYKIYFILFITQLSVCQPAFAQEQRYRVELLVLRHLRGTSDLTPQSTLRDFTAALDILAPPPETGIEAGVDRSEADEMDSAIAEPEQIPGEEASAAENLEPRVVLLQTQSDIMQQTWKRLSSSAAYRPELYISWEQPDAAPFPMIRVHDAEVLLEDDPYAAARPQTETSGSADAEGVESEADETGTAVTLPEPVRFYRIDGTARLRQSRFLHLDLDIEYREPVYTDVQPDRSSQGSDRPDGTSGGRSAYRVHTLRQSRQVQTKDMEYFDGPVLAVLALISRIDVPADETMFPGQGPE